jgi:hypothetical protein
LQRIGAVARGLPAHFALEKVWNKFDTSDLHERFERIVTYEWNLKFI